MKFVYKPQQYQTDAINAVVDVFKGQGKQEFWKYKRDVGSKRAMQAYQQELEGFAKTEAAEDLLGEIGYKNREIALTPEQLLVNIQNVQKANNVKTSVDKINDTYGCPALDVEMETGTGKTYVYIKTMYELNDRYGWNKFVIVVPSVAIREGVKKTFESTAETLQRKYGKKIRYFVYDSKNLGRIDSYSADPGINVMIINIQAFNRAMKENDKEGLIFNRPCIEAMGGRIPRNVVRANRPIIILDEPQKMGGAATKDSIKGLKPLFVLNYSATHKEQHDLVYVLDARDAYLNKLVKQIEVHGFKVRNLQGQNNYVYLDDIIIKSDAAPKARVQFEVKHNAGIKRETHILGVGADLEKLSNGLQQYDGYIVADINPFTAEISFTNGEVVAKAAVPEDMILEDRIRLQIRATIKAHFNKEEKLFKKGVKCLSLFFIDKVDKYRVYDEDGTAGKGQYAQMFEEEYLALLNENISVFDDDYQKYLREVSQDISKVHNGYFSIDKKGKTVDSHIPRSSDTSDDISAYDLILRNKERLLSFEEPTRFIFSHSALREGWDNPNIFQICALKTSQNVTSRRQEIGRGLRLCVDQTGNRLDKDVLGEDVFEYNRLTVIANESYSNFVDGLQKEYNNDAYERPPKADTEYFKDKVVVDNGGNKVTIDSTKANQIFAYLIQNGYVNLEDFSITEKYKTDNENKTIAPLPANLQAMGDDVHKLIQATYAKIPPIVPVPVQPIKNEFVKANLEKFKALWDTINHYYIYTVSYKSEDLIENVVHKINQSLDVPEAMIVEEFGRQRQNSLAVHDEYSSTTLNSELVVKLRSSVEYDLVGKIANGSNITRRSVVAILKGIYQVKLNLFEKNPEMFIAKVIEIIKEEKATMIVSKITYKMLEGKYDNDIFTVPKSEQSFVKAYKARKHIQEYVFCDGTAEKSVERRFVEDLDKSVEVSVYAKLPRGFKIPTPVGNYSPDWAIVFEEDSGVRHLFFVAETKGSMSSLQINKIEEAKIDFADKLFNKDIHFEKLHYHKVANYGDLMDLVKKKED